MRIDDRRLRHFIRESLLSEVGGSDLADDRAIQGMMDPEARRAMGQFAIKVGESVIDFTKSLSVLLAETWVYLRTGQQYIDAIRGITGVDLTPDDQRWWRSQIAAASLHDFLDNLGTGGLDAADITNGFLYMGEGEWRTAALCMIAAIPVVGVAISKSKGGKFMIAAADAGKLDEGISSIKKGLRDSGFEGADEVLAEIDRVRADMMGARADFGPYEKIPAEQTAAVEEVLRHPENLERAAEIVSKMKNKGVLSPDLAKQADDLSARISQFNFDDFAQARAAGFDTSNPKAVTHPDFPGLVVKQKAGWEIEAAEKYPGLVTPGKQATDARGSGLAIMEKIRPLHKVTPEELSRAIKREFPEIPDDVIEKMAYREPGDDMGEAFVEFFMAPVRLRSATTPEQVLDDILVWDFAKKSWKLNEDITTGAIDRLELLKDNEKFVRIADATRKENGYWQDMFRLDNMGLDSDGNIKILDFDVLDPEDALGHYLRPPRGATPPPIDDPAIKDIVRRVLSITNPSALGSLNESKGRRTSLSVSRRSAQDLDDKALMHESVIDRWRNLAGL